MKYNSLYILFLVMGCGHPAPKSTNVIGNDLPEYKEEIIEEPKIPIGAVIANFNGDGRPIYGYVKKIDPNKEITVISFENAVFPEIIIPESLGADLQLLKLENFDRDLLLVNAKLKDTNFNEYYLFELQNSGWKQVMNRFDIHKSNMTDTLIPISSNPLDSTQLLRYYSVFDMDRKSEKKYSWKLLRETVIIEK